MIPLRCVNILQTSLTRPDCQLWINFDQLSVAVQPMSVGLVQWAEVWVWCPSCVFAIYTPNSLLCNIQKGYSPTLCPYLHLYEHYVLEHKHRHMQFFLCPPFPHPSISSPAIAASLKHPAHPLHLAPPDLQFAVGRQGVYTCLWGTIHWQTF